MGNLTSKLKKPATDKEPPSAAVLRKQASTTGQSGPPPRPATKPIIVSALNIASKATESFSDTSKGQLTWSTLLSSGLTPSDQLTAGIATCPVSVGFLGHHRHEQPELYFILQGEGLIKVGSIEQKVSKGGLVFVPGNAEHGIRNLSDEEELVWFYCFPTDRFEYIVYEFSDSEKIVLER